VADLAASLRCLANPRRRRLLYHLEGREATTVEDLARVLAGSEPGGDRDVGDGGDRAGEFALELRHHHVPTLEELSVVEYDPRSGVVEVGEFPAELEALLEVTRRLDRGP
jgi:hypothetical protein